MIANISLVLRLKIHHSLYTTKKHPVFLLDFCSWTIGFACWNRWAIWVKCFCVPNRNYWASGMAELSLHPLLSGSMTKVSLWPFFFMKHVQNKCLWGNFPSIKRGAQELFGNTGREAAAAAGQDPSAPLQVVFHMGVSISAGHCCLTPQPTKTNPHVLDTVRHASRISQTNCPFSDFFTPPTTEGAQGQKLKQMHLPARHLVLSKATPTNTQTCS